MEDFGGKRACGGFVTFNEHSIMTQRVLASLKADNLLPQWMKMALSAHCCRLSQAQNMLLDQGAILALETAKYWKEVGSPPLIWTLPVQCRNCFSLF